MNVSSLTAQWLTAVLDEIDCGVLVIDADARLLHANRRGQQLLRGPYPLQLREGCVQTQVGGDAPALEHTLNAARLEGKRRLLHLGREDQSVHVAVVPLGEQAPHAATLLVLGRQQLGDPSLLHWYAHDHGLTPSEQRVLEGLARGQDPDGIAAHLQVGISTVRTHIGSLREKTGSPSIRALLHRMAALPPLAPRFPC